MYFEGAELTYPSAYKRLVTLHEAAYLFKSGTKNNGKIRDRAQHQHNCLKGVWTRVVKPTKSWIRCLSQFVCRGVLNQMPLHLYLPVSSGVYV